MLRTVFCRKYRQDMEGLEAPPFPGPKGREIYDNTSKKAWQEWLSHQTMLINEKHLNMLEPSSRAYLSTQMSKFLNGEACDGVAGYVPPEAQKDKN
ncbi:MAG: oxidative damage protection protein [Gammaproteobacteria bacterium]|nr:oxidative damage protection protein [Gammaproteobacteria bacterium]